MEKVEQLNKELEDAVALLVYRLMSERDGITQRRKLDEFKGLKFIMKSSETNHAGKPHFHVYYDGYEASFTIVPCHKLAGDFPKDKILSVLDWAKKNQVLLSNSWNDLPNIIKIDFPPKTG